MVSSESRMVSPIPRCDEWLRVIGCSSSWPHVYFLYAVQPWRNASTTASWCLFLAPELIACMYQWMNGWMYVCIYVPTYNVRVHWDIPFCYNSIVLDACELLLLNKTGGPWKRCQSFYQKTFQFRNYILVYVYKFAIEEKQVKWLWIILIVFQNESDCEYWNSSLLKIITAKWFKSD